MTPPPLARTLGRVRRLVGEGRVRFTLKALEELSQLAVQLDADDACDVLLGLTESDLAARMRSSLTGEWLHVFKPTVGETALYIKVVVRADCLVVSFHEDSDEAPA